MFLLLVVGGAIYVALGDLYEALILLASVVVVMAITVYQERKTERALDALRDLSSPRALVIRDGRRRRIAGPRRRSRRLAGSRRRRPRRGRRRLLEATGSPTNRCSPANRFPFPSARRAGTVGDGRAGRRRVALVYSGTLVVAGPRDRARARHGRPQPRSEDRRGAPDTRDREHASPAQTARIVRVSRDDRNDALPARRRPLRLDARRVARRAARGPHARDGGPPRGVSGGAHRVSRPGRVADLAAAGSHSPRAGDRDARFGHRPLRRQDRHPHARTAWRWQSWTVARHRRRSSRRPCCEYGRSGLRAATPSTRWSARSSITRLARDAETKRVRDSWKLVREYALRADLLAVTHCWRGGEEGETVIAAKGAPEAIARLCGVDTATGEPSRSGRARWPHAAGECSASRARALRARSSPRTHGLRFEFLGSIALADPVRANVPAAIARCRSAGVRVVMITGDHPGRPGDRAQIGLDVARAGSSRGTSSPR